MQVLVSGSTGFVGSALLNYLTVAGHGVVPLVRKHARNGSGSASVLWNPETGQIDTANLAGIEAVVHLAGENIASGRWTRARKLRLLNSRVKGTALLCESLAKMPRPPRVLVSASAIGYYGDRGSELLREESAPGRGFLADLCRQWESSTEAATRRGIRVVHLRIGIVLAPHGGVLGKLLLPFKMGVGGRVGSGDQFMSWILLADLCAAIVHSIAMSDLRGPVNAVAPRSVTNLEFTKTLGRVLSRPTILPLPAFAIHLALGEMGDELLLSSARVEPAKLLASGFRFQQPELEPALRSLLTR